MKALTVVSSMTDNLESFDIKTGIRQECLLSPFFFIFTIDWLMREATKGRRNGIQWTLLTHLDDLEYADNIALISHTKEKIKVIGSKNTSKKFEGTYSEHQVQMRKQ